MLNGIYTYNVDQKGRIVMPGRFLDRLGNPFALTGNPAGCLVAASGPDLQSQPHGVRGFVECHIKDRTGRFVIPSALRDFADLHQSGEAAVIGVGEEVEIWNKRRWESQARPPFPTAGRTSAIPESFLPPVATNPTPAAIIRQKALYGQPYLEVEGSLTVGETDRVLTRLETALRGRPRTVFLDLRGVDTLDAAFLMAMEPIARQLAAQGGRLAVLTERSDVPILLERLCGAKYVRVFTNLESCLWWLVDEGHA